MSHLHDIHVVSLKTKILLGWNFFYVICKSLILENNVDHASYKILVTIYVLDI